MVDKEKKLSKLRKLLALATGNANKAEAMAAVDKLQGMAAEYGISMDDIKAGSVEADEYRQESMYSGERDYGFVDRLLWKTIARFCCVKVNVGRDEDGDLTLIYFGHDVDVELAQWLRGSIRAAMAFEWGVLRDFSLDKRVSVAVQMESFHRGFAEEVRERMDSAVRATPSTGTELIVMKNALLDQRAADAGFTEAVGGRGRHVAVDAAAYGAGRAAGARVDIGRSVAGRASPARMIGR